MPFPKLLVTVGLFAIQTALTMSRRIEGPRIDDLDVAIGDYGAPLLRVWAKRRVSPPMFHAEPLTEVKRSRKTKGGKRTDYEYYATWAVALAVKKPGEDKAISHVTRIWMDTHLVYDATGAGPVSPYDFGGSGNLNDYVTIYTGTMDQEPDPRMETYIESLHGEGACPAYHGIGYVMFKGVPVTKFGGRIPQVEVEFITAAEPAYPWESKAGAFGTHLNLFTFSPDGARFMHVGSNDFAVWDTGARTQIASGSLGVNVNAGAVAGLKDDGSFYLVHSGNRDVLHFSADGLTQTNVLNVPSNRSQQSVRVLKDGAGVEHWLTLPYSVLRHFYIDGTEYRMEDLTGADWAPAGWFRDAHGDIWAVGRKPGSHETTVHFLRVIYTSGRGGTGYFTASGLAGTTSSIPEVEAIHYTGGGADQFVIEWEHSALYAIEVDTGTVLHSRSMGWLNVYDTDTQFANVRSGASSVWLGVEEVSLSDLHAIRTVNLSDWKVEASQATIFDPVNNALISSYTPGNLKTWRYLDRYDGEAVTLRQVIEDVHAIAGSDLSRIDASAQTQIVRGYSVGDGSGKDWLEPLLDIHGVKPRPHGFDLQYVNLGGDPGTAIAAGSIARGDGGESGPSYSAPRKGGSDLPVTVRLSFADAEADQQPNVAESPRLFEPASAREHAINLSTLVLSPDEARQLAGRYHRRLIFDRTDWSFALPASFIDLEPGDVRPLDLPDGLSVTARLESMVMRADRRIDLEWKRDDPAVAVLDGGSGAPFDGRDRPAVTVPMLSKGFVLDVPLLSDNDNSVNPILYLAAGPEATGAWPGATFWQLVAGFYDEEVGSVPNTGAAAWGTATDALADADPWIWDRGNSVNVMLAYGVLSGATEDGVTLSPATNMAAIGQPGRFEIINFTTATLEGDGSYTLSGLKRGRRGTNQHCASHEAGDLFVLLENTEIAAMGLSEVGGDLSFKAITEGRNESGALPIPLEPFTGASLKPLAPVYLTADQASADWVLGWTRRSRVGGAFGTGTAPLGEAFERYEVEILDGETVVRTVTVNDASSWTYDDTMQTADFGAPLGAAPSWRVYQISDAVGRGFAAAA